MPWKLRFRLKEHVLGAIWLVPCGCGFAGLFLGMAVWRLDRWTSWTLLDFRHDAATALTAAIVGAAITFVGTAFTVLLVAAQFASNQLTPRALKISLGDPLYRIALGLFVGTFVYAMVILARVSGDFVPQLGVVLAAGLTVASLLVYLILIGHLGRSFRPVSVAARVGREGRRALARIYREPAGGPEARTAHPGSRETRDPTRTIFHPGPPGILLAFDAEGLVAESRRADARLVLVSTVGDFVRTGAPLFFVFGPTERLDEARLHRAVAIGRERTLDQDGRFVFRILVDVAIRALSPAVNDPTSAVMAIDQIHDLLACLGRRRLDLGRHLDADGRLRLTVTMPGWDDYVSLAVDEIRHFGEGSVQIPRRLRAMLEDLLDIVPRDRKAPIERELRLLMQANERAFPDAEDRERASRADNQGLGSSGSSFAVFQPE